MLNCGKIVTDTKENERNDCKKYRLVIEKLDGLKLDLTFIWIMNL